MEALPFLINYICNPKTLIQLNVPLPKRINLIIMRFEVVSIHAHSSWLLLYKFIKMYLLLQPEYL